MGVKSNSRRILPNVGTAVIAIATAKNEQYVIRFTYSARYWCGQPTNETSQQQRYGYTCRRRCSLPLTGFASGQGGQTRSRCQSGTSGELGQFGLRIGARTHSAKGSRAEIGRSLFLHRSLPRDPEPDVDFCFSAADRESQSPIRRGLLGNIVLYDHAPEVRVSRWGSTHHECFHAGHGYAKNSTEGASSNDVRAFGHRRASAHSSR